MPPLEFYHGSLSITLSTIRDENKSKKNNFDELKNELERLKNEIGGDVKDLDESRLEMKQNIDELYLPVLKASPALLDIYTHQDYYNTLANRTYNVFFSRAFEILFYSFVCDCDKSKVIKDLKYIFNRPHFYSIHNVNPTKTFDTDDDGDKEIEFEKGNDQNIIEYLAETIVIWKKENKELFSLIKRKTIYPLFAAVFNKTFTQIHELKVKMCKPKSDYGDEYLSDIARRFEHIFINALVSLSKDSSYGDLVQANTALTSNYITLRSFDELSKYDKTLVKNTNFGKYSTCIEKQIMELAWSHPLFELNNCKSDILNNRFKINIPESFDLAKIKRDFNFFVKSIISEIKGTSTFKTGTLSEQVIRVWLERTNYEKYYKHMTRIISKSGFEPKGGYGKHVHSILIDLCEV